MVKSESVIFRVDGWVYIFILYAGHFFIIIIISVFPCP
jgi:hypothetical protein